MVKMCTELSKRGKLFASACGPIIEKLFTGREKAHSKPY
jgi:hypothetical protein